MSTAVNATVGTQSQHTKTIHDDDGSPFAQFAVAGSTANEADGSVDVEVVLLTTSADVVTVDFSVAGTAIYGSDHNRSPSLRPRASP